MGNGDPKIPGKDEPEYVPLSEFKLFGLDDEPAPFFQKDEKPTGQNGGWKPFESGAPSELVDGILDRGRMYRDHMLKNTDFSKVPSNNKKLTPANAVALAKFPHIRKKLEDAWGNAELFHVHLKEFGIMEERSGLERRGQVFDAETERRNYERRSQNLDADGKPKLYRDGFPPEVFEEIMILAENHEHLFEQPGEASPDASIKDDPYSHTHSK